MIVIFYSVGTEELWIGVLRNGQEGVKRGFKGSTFPFSGEYPILEYQSRMIFEYRPKILDFRLKILEY